ncbi:NAD(P)-dependent oxidoreductase, short chain dehydrogenase/reductase family protein [Arthrobacter crystallopoietes BAB-32]|uniref:NAD(P)-dependent oxidoreductase, short chain dehydrogenase/reductase family protein n=1 Tax=Arthrobacter crystallopoietes BAB-32 TaxID=1246476 RepID=N1V2J7_9MICC|nr:glucose 1-dehydrogenase [Arthrobacter crystallopoietes]EMY34277.1 NAD(P)-dependent oxidoreductase, short chain dehydrogenase/reductase family protein [Arthrobacter crystallopoietes BAB-32]
MSQEPHGTLDEDNPREPAVDVSTETQEYPGFTKEMEPRPDHGEDSYRGNDRLKGKKALVTGGDSGIGRAVALAFAREGADVAISYLKEEEEDGQDCLELILAEGRNALAVPGDVREEDYAAKAVGEVVGEFGGLDILVNNAGYHLEQPGGIADISPDQLRRTFETNVYGTVWMIQAALPHLSPGAVIINTTSIQGHHPSTGLMDYAATKAALNNLTFSLAELLGPKGIRVNAVAPGPIWTPLQPATTSEEKLEKFGDATPLGRAGQPAEVAGAFVYLASNDARYVSGEIIGVTGGMHLA